MKRTCNAWRGSRSSVDQSIGLRNRVSQVRVLSGAPELRAAHWPDTFCRCASFFSFRYSQHSLGMLFPLS